MTHVFEKLIRFYWNKELQRIWWTLNKRNNWFLKDFSVISERNFFCVHLKSVHLLTAKALNFYKTKKIFTSINSNCSSTLAFSSHLSTARSNSMGGCSYVRVPGGHHQPGTLTVSHHFLGSCSSSPLQRKAKNCVGLMFALNRNLEQHDKTCKVPIHLAIVETFWTDHDRQKLLTEPW